MITVYIDNKKYQAKKGQTIISLLLEAKIDLAFLAYHPDLDNLGGDRIALVEIGDNQRIVNAETTKVYPQLKIYTETELVKKYRKANAELLFASHSEKCATCTRRFNCGLLSLARRDGLNIATYPDRKLKRKTFKIDHAIEIDSSQCIDCGNCIQACQRQGINYLEYTNTAHKQELRPSSDKTKICLHCGQCTLVCPVASAQEQDQWAQVETLLADPKAEVVALLDPASRVSLGEAFQLRHSDSQDSVYLALAKLGFRDSYDLALGAEMLSQREAKELLERKEAKQKLPLISSACPAWSRYLEHYQPKLKPYLAKSRSAQLLLAQDLRANYKTAKDKELKLVSIVACPAKKEEVLAKKSFQAGKPLIDNVITLRELVFMLKKRDLDLAKLKVKQTKVKPVKLSAISAHSGGLTELLISNILQLKSVAKETRKKMLRNTRLLLSQNDGFIELNLEIAQAKYSFACFNGIASFIESKADCRQYDYIEVMACPGGCLGGGGQIIPTTKKIISQRQVANYRLSLIK